MNRKPINYLIYVLISLCFLGFISKYSTAATIKSAEYYFDDDPGEGNGIYISPEYGSFDKKYEEVFTSGVSVSHLSIGWHMLYIRGMDSNDRWGPSKGIPVRIKTSPQTGEEFFSVTSADYFFDNDPGEGKGKPLLAVDGNYNSYTEHVYLDDIDTSQLSEGQHTLYIRGQNNDGVWGDTFTYPFTILPPKTVMIPENLTIVNDQSTELSYNSIALAWNSQGEDIQYNVYRSNVIDGFYVIIDPTRVENNQFYDIELHSDVEYCYKVTAVDSSNDESDMSDPVCGKPAQLNKAIYSIMPLNDYQLVKAGDTAEYKINFVAEGNYTDELQIIIKNLPLDVTYELKPSSVKPTGMTSLKIFVPGNMAPVDKDIMITTDDIYNNIQAFIRLKVVQLEDQNSAINTYLDKKQIQFGNYVQIAGNIIPKQFNSPVYIDIKHESNNAYQTYTSTTDDSGFFQFRFTPEQTGLYDIHSRWDGNSIRNASQSTEDRLTVFRGKSHLTCYTDQKEINPDDTVVIKGTLSRPSIRNQPILIQIQSPDNVIRRLPPDSIYTDEKGKYEYTIMLDQKGIWNIDTCWKGNDLSEGSISKTLRLYPGIEAGLSIILAGGGLENNTLWPTTRYLTSCFYQMLLRRQFSHDLIHFISPGEAKDNIVIDDNSPTVEDLQLYLASLYDDNVNNVLDEDSPLLIYLCDHGGKDMFKISSGSYLKAADLDQWLDQLQSNINCPVQIILEACYSGSFVDNLMPSDGQKRIIIASTGANAVSIYDQNGRESFSQHFFNQISQNYSLGECFSITWEKIRKKKLFKSQIPIIEDGNNGDLAKLTYIGGTFVIGDILPEITEHTPNQIIDSHSCELFAKVIDIEGMNRVWATIMPPYYHPPEVSNEFDTPEIFLDTIELLRLSEQNDLYSGSYDKFNLHGTYVITIYAMDTGENVVSKEVLLTVEGLSIDIDGDGIINLSDAILLLRLLCGFDSSSQNLSFDIDHQIGLAEVIFLCQKIANLDY